MARGDPHPNFGALAFDGPDPKVEPSCADKLFALPDRKREVCAKQVIRDGGTQEGFGVLQGLVRPRPGHPRAQVLVRFGDGFRNDGGVF